VSERHTLEGKRHPAYPQSSTMIAFAPASRQMAPKGDETIG